MLTGQMVHRESFTKTDLRSDGETLHLSVSLVVTLPPNKGVYSFGTLVISFQFSFSRTTVTSPFPLYHSSPRPSPPLPGHPSLFPRATVRLHERLTRTRVVVSQYQKCRRLPTRLNKREVRMGKGEPPQ